MSMQEAIPDRLAYSIEEAQVLLGGISRDTIYGLRARGELRFVKVGRRSLIPAEDIRRIVTSTHDDPRSCPDDAP